MITTVSREYFIQIDMFNFVQIKEKHVSTTKNGQRLKYES